MKETFAKIHLPNWKFYLSWAVSQWAMLNPSAWIFVGFEGFFFLEENGMIHLIYLPIFFSNNPEGYR